MLTKTPIASKRSSGGQYKIKEVCRNPEGCGKEIEVDRPKVTLCVPVELGRTSYLLYTCPSCELLSIHPLETGSNLDRLVAVTDGIEVRSVEGDGSVPTYASLEEIDKRDAGDASHAWETFEREINSGGSK